MPRNDLLLRAARGERTERTPVWLMRQAGRFDPAYQALRRRADLPLEELFRRPEPAAEISLLPKRFGVDAIIFFQDILMPLGPMGAPFVFRPGPVLAEPIRSVGDVERLRPIDPRVELAFVPATLRLIQEQLKGELPLLGFAGGPLTLAVFLIEGGSAGTEVRATRAMMSEEPAAFHRLLRLLADMTADYLALQIEAGVDAVQLFESYADLLTPEEYRAFAHPYHVSIFEQLGGRVPTILFAKDHPDVDLMARSGADVLSIGSGVNLAQAKALIGDRVALQGNVDNRVLLTGPAAAIEEAVEGCVVAGGHEGHILNLGHGVLRDTPVENVVRFIEAARRQCVSRQPPAVTAR